MGSKNAGHLAAAILALQDPSLRRKIASFRERMEREILEKSKSLPRRMREVIGGEK
jgi:phosphoribosylcarboxyaminoimidazole (NCAIR) mutase